MDSEYAIPFDPYVRRRRRTRPVRVGGVTIGGAENPIVVQSMITADTLDTEAAVREIRALAQTGCQIVRLAVPTTRHAANLEAIRKRLAQADCDVPLVADIHFSPEAALLAAEFVAKVRINPGNYADRKRDRKKGEYTAAEYQTELDRVAAALTPLIAKCQERGIALRLGANHGSLSERILNRYGNTPRGLVESVLEFARICRRHDYHEVILSLKSSRPRMTIQAGRLLAAILDAEGLDYPLHLGVTEAGGEVDGRVKSAIGIGSLLADGIGDTIRVSLTEAAVNEIPVARALAEPFQPPVPPQAEAPKLPCPISPFAYQRRAARELGQRGLTLGGAGTPVRVQVGVPVPRGDLAAAAAELAPLFASPAAAAEILRFPVRHQDDIAVVVKLRRRLAEDGYQPLFNLDLGRHYFFLAAAVEAGDIVTVRPLKQSLEAQMAGIWIQAGSASGRLLQIDTTESDLDAFGAFLDVAAEKGFTAFLAAVRATTAVDTIASYRLLTAYLAEREVPCPIVIRNDIRGLLFPRDNEAVILKAAMQIGSLLCDGIGDVVEATGGFNLEKNLGLTYDILQAAGTRRTRADIVACPSCGRTLFDLRETAAQVRAATGHLRGLTIAVMGCVVNGPGELAEADFGYLGGAPGKVDLYAGRECVERNIPSAEAVARLVELIKARGRWEEAAEE